LHRALLAGTTSDVTARRHAGVIHTNGSVATVVNTDRRGTRGIATLASVTDRVAGLGHTSAVVTGRSSRTEIDTDRIARIRRTHLTSTTGGAALGKGRSDTLAVLAGGSITTKIDTDRCITR